MIEFNLYVEANNFRELGYKREEGNQRFSLINFLKKDSNYACHNFMHAKLVLYIPKKKK